MSSNAISTLRFPAKALRSRIVGQYIFDAGYAGAVIFTCGNAASELRAWLGAGRQHTVLEIGPRGALIPGKWWAPAEIRRTWPTLFDATSGHLPAHLMAEIAKEFKRWLGTLAEPRYFVPSGSGETIVCLRLAYPEIEFIPLYDSSKPETVWHTEAPLNMFVDAQTKSKENSNGCR